MGVLRGRDHGGGRLHFRVNENHTHSGRSETEASIPFLEGAARYPSQSSLEQDSDNAAK